MGSHPHQKDCNGTLKVFGSSQRRFMKGKSSLNNLTAFHNEMTGLADEGEQWVVFIVSLERLSTLPPVTSLRRAGEV